MPKTPPTSPEELRALARTEITETIMVAMETTKAIRQALAFGSTEEVDNASEAMLAGKVLAVLHVARLLAGGLPKHEQDKMKVFSLLLAYVIDSGMDRDTVVQNINEALDRADVDGTIAEVMRGISKKVTEEARPTQRGAKA